MVDVNEEGKLSRLVWNVAIVFLLVGVIAAVSLYYRRRIRNLRTTIHDVEFHARPRNFENPGYVDSTHNNPKCLRMAEQSEPLIPSYKLDSSAKGKKLCMILQDLILLKYFG